MRAAATLRAGSQFTQTFLHGEKIEGKYLRCHFLLSEESGPVIRVGYAVPSRRFNAVRRNRIRRLLREAVSRESPVLEESLSASRRHVSAVFYFRGSKTIPVDQMRLSTLQPDVATLCRTVAARLQLDQRCQP